MPFKKNYYDFVVCLGVLQHTPSSEKSISYLWEKLKPGGKLVIDHYLFKLRTSLPPPFGQALNVYRFFILMLPLKKRFKIIKFLVNFWFPLHWRFKNYLIIQKILRRLSPVIFHYGTIKLKNKKYYYNWALLDTHDSLTDFYKHKLTKAKLLKILNKLKAKKINISYNGNGLEARCLK